MMGDGKFTLADVALKLAGRVRPTGQHEVDAERIHNLESLISMTREILEYIEDIAALEGSHEASVAAIGKLAAKFMKEIREEQS